MIGYIQRVTSTLSFSDLFCFRRAAIFMLASDAFWRDEFCACWCMRCWEAVFVCSVLRSLIKLRNVSASKYPVNKGSVINAEQQQNNIPVTEDKNIRR